MKTILTTIILVLATSQVNADGFYQAIVGNSPQSSKQVSNVVSETSYSPLYNQVTSSAKVLASQETIGPRSEFTYTPLYLQVLDLRSPGQQLPRLLKSNPTMKLSQHSINRVRHT